MRQALLVTSIVLVSTLFAAVGKAELVSSTRLGSAVRGARIFERCKECHSLEPGVTVAGPTLYGLFGRKAGTVPGFAYSKAMRQSKIIWNEDTLSEYLANPKLPRHNKMERVPGIKDPSDLGNLLEYLRRAGP